MFAAIAKKFIGDEDREVFLVGCLNAKNELQSLHRCDIEFALAVLRREYEQRKKVLLESNLEARRKCDLLADLECILSSIIKIEYKFNL